MPLKPLRSLPPYAKPVIRTPPPHAALPAGMDGYSVVNSAGSHPFSMGPKAQPRTPGMPLQTHMPIAHSFGVFAKVSAITAGALVCFIPGEAFASYGPMEAIYEFVTAASPLLAMLGVVSAAALLMQLYPKRTALLKSASAWANKLYAKRMDLRVKNASEWADKYFANDAQKLTADGKVGAALAKWEQMRIKCEKYPEEDGMRKQAARALMAEANLLEGHGQIAQAVRALEHANEYLSLVEEQLDDSINRAERYLAEGNVFLAKGRCLILQGNFAEGGEAFLTAAHFFDLSNNNSPSFAAPVLKADAWNLAKWADNLQEKFRAAETARVEPAASDTIVHAGFADSLAEARLLARGGFMEQAKAKFNEIATLAEHRGDVNTSRVARAVFDEIAHAAETDNVNAGPGGFSAKLQAEKDPHRIAAIKTLRRTLQESVKKGQVSAATNAATELSLIYTQMGLDDLALFSLQQARDMLSSRLKVETSADIVQAMQLQLAEVRHARAMLYLQEWRTMEAADEWHGAAEAYEQAAQGGDDTVRKPLQVRSAQASAFADIVSTFSLASVPLDNTACLAARVLGMKLGGVAHQRMEQGEYFLAIKQGLMALTILERADDATARAISHDVLETLHVSYYATGQNALADGIGHLLPAGPTMTEQKPAIPAMTEQHAPAAATLHGGLHLVVPEDALDEAIAIASAETRMKE